MRETFTPIVVNHPQRSAEWYQARLGNVTASAVSKTREYYAVTKKQVENAIEYYALNKHLREPEWIERMSQEYPTEFILSTGIQLMEKAERKTYRETLVAERITGMDADEDAFVSRAMKWGIVLEPRAKAQYSTKFNMKVVDAPLMLHPYLLCGASPDGLVIDKTTGELGNLEIKCLESRNHLYKAIKLGEVPPEHNDQIQMQMWITGRDWCDFVAYDERPKKEELRLFVKRVAYDEFFVDNVLVPSIRRFLDECDHDERQFYAIAKAKAEKIHDFQPS